MHHNRKRDGTRCSVHFTPYTITISSTNSCAATAQSNLDGAIEAILRAYGRLSGNLSIGGANGPILVHILVNLSAYGQFKAGMANFVAEQNGTLSVSVATGTNGIPIPIHSSMDVVVSLLGWPSTVVMALQRASRFNDEPNQFHMATYAHPPLNDAEAYSLEKMPQIDGSPPNSLPFWPPTHNLRNLLQAFYKMGRKENMEEDAAEAQAQVQAQAQPANEQDGGGYESGGEADFDSDED